jgi:hypothetical protein
MKYFATELQNFPETKTFISLFGWLVLVCSER